MTQLQQSWSVSLRGAVARRIMPVIGAAFLSQSMAPGAVAQTPTQVSRVSKLPIRGVVRPLRQAAIATEIVAKVETIGFREGERFKKGQLLIAFDCRRHMAELASAEAQHQEMKVALETNAFLEKRNAGSRQDLEIAKARAAKAAADVDGLRVRLDQCMIKAPFDGRVAELTINEHEMPVTGKPIIAVLADGELEIDLILPSDWLGWLKEKMEFTFVIDETARSYQGEVVRIGAAVDTISQTIKITGRFGNVDAAVLPGMSGAATFSNTGG